MSFRLTGLARQSFAAYFQMSDAELAARGARRCVVDTCPGYPDRVELRDLEIGETALLVNFVHQPANTPFRASHAVYIGERSTRTYDAVDQIPEVLRRRTLSLRAFDSRDMLSDALLVDGREAESSFERLLADARTAYVHVHYAGAGCYAALLAHA